MWRTEPTPGGHVDHGIPMKLQTCLQATLGEMTASGPYPPNQAKFNQLTLTPSSLTTLKRMNLLILGALRPSMMKLGSRLGRRRSSWTNWRTLDISFVQMRRLRELLTTLSTRHHANETMPIGILLSFSRTTLTPDYSWIRLIKASDPTFSCGRGPVPLKSLSIRPIRLKNRTIGPVSNASTAISAVPRRQFDCPVIKVHRFGPFPGLDFPAGPYPGAQDTRCRRRHNRCQSVAA